MFNAAAVTAAENFRTMGWRGHHLNVLICLSLVGKNVMADHLSEPSRATVLDGLKYLGRERARWPDDLTDEREWGIAKAMTGFLISREIEECGKGILRVPEADLCRLQKMLTTALRHGHLALSATKIAIAEDSKTLSEDVARCIAYEAQKFRLSKEERSFVSGLIVITSKWLAEHGTSRPMTLAESWDLSRPIYNVTDLPIKVGEVTAPAITKQRRLNGNVPARAAFMPALSRVIATIRAQSNGDPGFSQFSKDTGVYPLLHGDKSQIFLSTCMRVEAYEEFKKCGRYRDVWETGATWHRQYSDQPLVARANHEMRLFGERGDGITYGYLTTCEGWQDDVSLAGRRGYGDVEIFWKPELVRYCIFTIEDSHGAPFIMDANNADSVAFAALISAVFHPWEAIRNHRYLPNLSPRFTPNLAALAGRFLEFQCHKILTPDDVESVVVHGKEVA